MTCEVIVSKTPDGWAADCLTCPGSGTGGPLDLGEYTTGVEADHAAQAHQDATAGIPVCPTCGHRMEPGQ